MKSVVRWAIKNSPAMNTILVVSLLIGAISLIVMRREIFPEFQLEILLVSVAYPGASPDETEEAICEKIEAAVKGVDGVKKITSVAREGSGFVILELSGEVKDVQRVLNDVRSQIDQIPSFPDTVEAPDIRQIVFRAPAIQVAILGPEDATADPLERERQLRALAEEVREDILQQPPATPLNPLRQVFHSMIAPPGQPAVSEANIVAARDYQIDVEIPESRLRDFGLSLEQVASIIRMQNVDLPGGKMVTDSQELLLRGKNKREVGQDIENITILTRPSGEGVTAGQLGNVIDGFADTTSEHRVDGRPAMVISISKTSNEDMFTVVDTVKAYAETKQLPDGYDLKLFQDLSVDVRDRISLLTRNGLQGLLLVFLVLAIFLDLRLAFWVALGIPVAILSAGFILLLCGQTLNMLSMFAFLMALGIVVDDAIVIGENIYQKRQDGMPYVKAAVEGTYEVLPSVCASVTTTIIAFLPLMFVSGVMGKFLAVMPMAVIAMLVISLIESTFILPAHLAHDDNLFMKFIGSILYVFKPLLTPLRWVNKKATGAMSFVIERIYMPFLAFALDHKRIVLAGAFGIIMIAAGFVASGITPFEFFPKIDTRNISATIVFPDGTASDFAKNATVELENALRRVDEQIELDSGKSILRVVYRRVGEVGDGGGGPTGITNGSHVGTVEVELVTTAEREISSQEIIERWRAEMPKIPGSDVVKFGSRSMGPGGNQIEFKLLALSDSVDSLEPAAEECKEYLAKKVGVTDIEDDYRLGKWEMHLKLNEMGLALGLDESALARTVRGSYYGEEVMRLQRGRHEVKLMVRYPESERKSMERFDDIMIRDNSGNERPLKDVAIVEFVRANSEINRLNQKRSITVSADVDKLEGGNAAAIIGEMQREFLPDLLNRYQKKGKRLYVNWEGQQQQNQESMTSMGIGFGIALLGMFVLLTLEFRSYVQPAIIMAIIPFGMIGAIFGHAVMGLPFTLFSFFGIIALTGVVVNDSIVLVDFINARVRAGLPINEALVDAGRRRFRPIMLTSFTTIAGLFPMLLERSFQAQVLIPMAASIIFGLMLGTTFILVLVPIFYKIFANIALHFGFRLEHDDEDKQHWPGERGEGSEPDEQTPENADSPHDKELVLTRNRGDVGPALS